MRHSPSDPRALLVRLHGSYKMRVTTSRTENPQGFVGVEMYWGLYNFFSDLRCPLQPMGKKWTHQCAQQTTRQICQVFRKTIVSCSVALWEVLQGSEFQTWKRLLFYRVFPQLHDTVVQVGCRSVLAEALQGSWACKYMIWVDCWYKQESAGKEWRIQTEHFSESTDQCHVGLITVLFFRHPTSNDYTSFGGFGSYLCQGSARGSTENRNLECLKAPSEPKNA